MYFILKILTYGKILSVIKRYMNEISQNRVQSGVVETKASIPLVLSTQLTAHTIESGSTSAGLGPHAGKRGRERERDTHILRERRTHSKFFQVILLDD